MITDYQQFSLCDAASWQDAQTTLGGKFATMLAYYLEDSAQYLDAVTAGIAAQDYAQVTAPAHSLKSSSRQLGFFRLAEIAKTIEHGGRENADWALLKAQLPIAQQTFAEVQHLVQQAA